MGDAGDDPPPPPAAADPATGPEGAPDADGPDGGAENGAPGGGAEGAGGMPEGGQGPHEEEPGSGSAVADRLKAVRKGGRPGGMRRLTVLPTAGQTAALAGAQVRPRPLRPTPFVFLHHSPEASQLTRPGPGLPLVGRSRPPVRGSRRRPRAGCALLPPPPLLSLPFLLPLSPDPPPPPHPAPEPEGSPPSRAGRPGRRACAPAVQCPADPVDRRAWPRRRGRR